MEAQRKVGRPRVVEKPAVVNTIIEDAVARRLKLIAIERGVLPSEIFRAALNEYAERHAAPQ